MSVNGPLANSLLEKMDLNSYNSSIFVGENRTYSFFTKIQKAMGYLPNFIETFKAILNGVMEEIDADNCSLMLIDPQSGELSVVAARGKGDQQTAHYPFPNKAGKRFKSGEGIAGWVLKAGQAMIINNTKEAPLFIHFHGNRKNGSTSSGNKIKAILCFPIRENDRVVGVFNISHSKPDMFQEWEKLAVAYVSNQIGAALTFSRFFLPNKAINHYPQARSFLTEKTTASSNPYSSIIVEESEPDNNGNGKFIYASNRMYLIKEMIDQIAEADVAVLIQGESGVGKEVVARSIYANSQRRDKPFVKVNCAALPSELLESELFGYEKGAFTGAYRQKPGKFELAQGGIIFLDEIGEIKASLQAKLLQVLQDGEFSRLGGKKDVKVDVRVLAATNRNIEEAVKKGTFREDFYYRLNIVNVTIPPLRERKEEIPFFVEYFLDKFGNKYKKKVESLSDNMMKALIQYDWPGNIRELENVIQRFIVLGFEETIIAELSSLGNKEVLPETKGSDARRIIWPSLKSVNRRATVKAESEIIRKVLDLTFWNRKKAADILNISYKTLLYKIKECQLNEKAG